jgi:LuxR family transcriptional regulator, maltose regulon positive regulatory protein
MDHATNRNLNRNRQVRRDRLLAKLDRLGMHRVNLVCGPAGFGKTTAVRQWLEPHGEPTVWIDLDVDDNDPFRLWSRIIDGSIRDFGLGVRAKVALGGSARSVRPAIERLGEDLAAGGHQVCLVLDDLHLIENRDCLRSIEMAIDLFGSHSRTVLISRTVPELPLQRYTGRAQLLRIGSSDLAFDEAETLSLLADEQGTAVDPELAGQLCERTGGWPAALYMSSLWLQDNPDPVEASRLLPQREERIADFLMSEVIGALDPEVREFLERTSFLGWMSGDLCDEVCGFSGSSEMLENVCRENQLVERDRKRPGWFRYHALMRDLCLDRMERERPRVLADLRRRAIEWHLREGMIDAAADLAIEAGEFSILADLLEAKHLELASVGRVITVWRWGRVIPNEILAGRPELALVIALAADDQAVPAVKIRRLVATATKSRDAADHDWRPVHEALWQTLTALTAERGVGASIESARLAVVAVKEMPQHHLNTDALLAVYLEMDGEFDEAEQLALRVVESPDAETRPHALIFAIVSLVHIENSRGHLHAAESWVRSGHDAVSRFGLQDTRVGSMVQLADAEVALSAGDLARAGRLIERAMRVEFEDPPMKARVLMVAARIRALRGQVEQARGALDMFDEMVETCPDIGRSLRLREEVKGLIDESGSSDSRPSEPLSKAELRILPLLERGASRTEMAEDLFLSVNTVKSHMRSIYRKLGAGNREDALARARASGLL